MGAAAASPASPVQWASLSRVSRVSGARAAKRLLRGLSQAARDLDRGGVTAGAGQGVRALFQASAVIRERGPSHIT